MTTNVQTELSILINTHFRILFGMLRQKGLVDYKDLHEQIAQVRDTFSEEVYTPFIAANLNIMESLYQDGNYQSPIPKPGDPDHPSRR